MKPTLTTPIKPMINEEVRHTASFRDPSGFLFSQEGTLYRQVNDTYKPDFQMLMDSGLYDSLVSANLLVAHQVKDIDPPLLDRAYLIIQPALVPFISFPYEWSFSQLKDAALATLKVQKMALAKGMSLKDASAYNIQFYRGRPLLIDTLSFERYQEGKPWAAYRQFCQHFLAPLALMAHTDVRLSQLLRVYIDGVPLDLASKLLPTRTRLSPSLMMHIHLHASAQKRYADKDEKKAESPTRTMSRNAFVGIIDSLETAVRKLKWQGGQTEWADYYDNTNYSSTAINQKRQIVENYLQAVQPKPQMVWDLGANDGTFSRLASSQGILTVAFDIDPSAVESNYLQVKAKSETNLLPLLMDLTNPSADIGWHGQERQSLQQRGPADVVLALALMHHLAIGNNVPFPQLAQFFADVSSWLIIEFIPKQDSQVEKLLSGRLDIFSDYHQDGFEEIFKQRFDIKDKQEIPGSKRILYLMKRKF